MGTCSLSSGCYSLAPTSGLGSGVCTLADREWSVLQAGQARFRLKWKAVQQSRSVVGPKRRAFQRVSAQPNPGRIRRRSSSGTQGSRIPTLTRTLINVMQEFIYGRSSSVNTIAHKMEWTASISYWPVTWCALWGIVALLVPRTSYMRYNKNIVLLRINP